MAELSTIARPYAEAVFELAKTSDQFDKWSEMLTFLEAVVTDSEIAVVITNPSVEKETLRKLFLDIGGQLDEKGKNLLQVLVDNRRLMVIPHIAIQYERLKAEYLNYVKVSLTSPYEVTEEQQESLSEALQKRLGKSILMEVSLDPALIGGWLIHAGDQVLDLSIKGRLQQLAAELQHG